MINWQNKAGLQKALDDAGYDVRDHDGVHVSSVSDAVVNDFITNYDPLPKAKALKIEEIKAETLLHITNEMEAIKDFAMLEYTYHFWMSIAGGAKAATTSWQEFIDVAVLGRAAIQTINDSVDLNFVETFNPATDIAWPL